MLCWVVGGAGWRLVAARKPVSSATCFIQVPAMAGAKLPLSPAGPAPAWLGQGPISCGAHSSPHKSLALALALVLTAQPGLGAGSLEQTRLGQARLQGQGPSQLEVWLRLEPQELCTWIAHDSLHLGQAQFAPSPLHPGWTQFAPSSLCPNPAVRELLGSPLLYLLPHHRAEGEWSLCSAASAAGPSCQRALPFLLFLLLPHCRAGLCAALPQGSRLERDSARQWRHVKGAHSVVMATLTT